MDTWDVKLYGSWHRRETSKRVLTRWTQNLREPYDGQRARAPYTWVELPGLDLKVHADWSKASGYNWADEGTFEVKLAVDAATERAALRKAQAVVRRRLSAQMCTPPRLEFT